MLQAPISFAPFDEHDVPERHAAAVERTTAGRSRRISPLLITALAGGSEFLILALTGMVTAALWVDRADAVADARYLVVIAATAFGAVLATDRLQLYSAARLLTPLRALAPLAGAWLMTLGVLVAAIFLFKSGADFSRGWLLLWAVSGLAGVLTFRLGARLVLRRLADAGRLSRRAVVFGAGDAGAALVKRLETDPDSDVRIAGLFDDRGEERVPASLKGYPLLGNVDQLVTFCRQSEIDLLILSLPLTAERRVLEVLKKLWVLPIDIRLAAHASSIKFRPRTYSHVGSVPLLDVVDRPLGELDRVVKSVFDRIVAGFAVVLLAPVMAAVALAVKLDSRGPILFRQKRLGFNNELIDVWKFRSMYVEASDQTAAKLVTKGDPRVTRVGRFIRKTSLDELPQLFNVLGGSLSLVGPRPHALHAKAADRLYHDVIDGYFARHKVKPGITGLAQIRGWRGETDTTEKLEGRIQSDLEYIENWSLLLDITILARTPMALLKTDNAY